VQVGVCDCLELQEFAAERAEVNGEGAGGGWARREGLGEEFVVGFGSWFWGGLCGCFGSLGLSRGSGGEAPGRSAWSFRESCCAAEEAY